MTTNTPLHITLSGQLSQRVGPEIWAKIKAHMQYYDEDLIEEMDWFGMQPGWYVTNESEVERILSVPEEWRVAPRRVKAKQEEAEAKKREERERQETAERIGRKRTEYATWKQQTLAGLESFHAWFEDFPKLEWEDLASFDKEAGWFDTGDRWGKSTWDGDVIYRNSYGNTTAYYTTHANAVKLARMELEWSRKFYPTEVELARHVLMTHDRGCIGDDPARLVVQEDGIHHYIDIAKQETWYIIARDHRSDDFWQTADKYGLPYVELTRTKNIYSRDCPRAVSDAFRKRMDEYFNTPYSQYSCAYYLPEEDRWFVSKGHTTAEAVPAPDLSDLFPELMK